MRQQELIQADETTNVSITAVRFEHFREAFGIGENRPRLSWTIATERASWYQSGYQIESYWPGGRLRERTERIASSQSVLVPWPFASLVSRESLTVRVRVWGSDGQPSAWSAHFPVEAGLFRSDDWTAGFVTPDCEEDTSQPQPGPLLRRAFDVRANVQKAR
jgi:alpha-L-rhamnosidase